MFRNGLEPWHLLIFAVVLLLVFGSKKLPDMARSLGKSARILKSEAKAMKEDGAAPAPAAQPPSEPASDATAARVIQSSPGDAASARPVSEDSTVR